MGRNFENRIKQTPVEEVDVGQDSVCPECPRCQNIQVDVSCKNG
jgi:hypothetical protein